tara:strand:- start:1112 stop:1324 length:213 start_codon:yes stop_codon:yes gene_type:complete
MVDFITGVFTGLGLLFGVFCIYLFLDKRKSDAALRRRIKKYTYKNDEVFLGEYPNIPTNKFKEKNYEKKN